MSPPLSATVFFDRWMARGRMSFGARVARLRSASWQVGQCALAAGIAWWLAHDVLDHSRPFFAPVAAVVGLGTSYGQRLRRVGEITVGVAVGVFLGDLFTHVLGSGPWQLALLVAGAMSTALLLDAGTLFVNQAAVQSIVVAVALPNNGGGAFTRWTDALIGGAVALVAASVVPATALRRPHQQAARVADAIASLLRAAADCMTDADFDHALSALSEARGTDRLVGQLKVAAGEGLSLVASSPFRRRRHGPTVRKLAEIVDPLDFALRNTRVLLRRVAVATYRSEPLPPQYADAARGLAAQVDVVAAELAAGHTVEGAREGLIRFGESTSLLPRTVELSGEVVLAQLRSITADLLACAGLDPVEATEAIPPLGG
ncbi:MAG TPA: FUSC family protein [Nocardioides sp.]|nr:FUSC family protein [Nocardioides sp.]